jgi:hypothetical protein
LFHHQPVERGFHVGGSRMSFTKSFGGDVVGTAHKQSGPGNIGSGVQKLRQHTHGAGSLGMFRSPGFFRDGQRSAIQRFGFIEPAFAVK